MTTHTHSLRLLTLNTGSSSLKAARYVLGDSERLDFAAQVDRIGQGGQGGQAGGRLHITDADGNTLLDQAGDFSDHAAALDALLAWLHGRGDDGVIDTVGHRVVHGGAQYREPTAITDDLLAALRGLVAIDPDHLPQAIATIEAVRRAYPDLPQVACFDTAFHARMPAVAQAIALPAAYTDMTGTTGTEAGVRRYGFHGLSYEYITNTLRAMDAAAAAGRVVIAHLGNGASMAAVRDGVGIETTMGFTPTGGLVMGTRTGDLDPGVLIYLLRERGLSVSDLSDLVNKEAGLRGVSGTSGDMRDLLSREASDPRAAAAVALFCYTAKKHLGALVATLGGLDTLVFTGGIGEHAAPVRERICAGLGFLGITIDAGRNAAHAPVISADGAPVTVRVMATDEDLMIARHTFQLITHPAGSGR